MRKAAEPRPDPKLPSSLSKEGVQPVALQPPFEVQPDALKLFEERFGYQPGFAKTCGRLILDRTLPDLAKTIYSFIGLCSWKAPAALTFEDIAESANCSRRAAVYNCQLLESTGYLQVIHRRRRPNVYSLPPDGWAKPTPVKPVVTETYRCPRCGQQRKQILRAGWCRSCNTDINVKRASAETTYQILKKEKLLA